MSSSCFHLIRLNSKLYLRWATIEVARHKLQDLRTRESNEEWPFVQANWLSNANKLAFRKTYKEGTRWEVCGWPWEKVAVSGSHEAVLTTWKTLERRATTLYCLYHRSPTKITGKEVLRSLIVPGKGREKKLSPFVNGEFAYKMKERPTHRGGVSPLGKNTFPIFRSMHMHFPSPLHDLSLSSLSLSLCARPSISEFLIRRCRTFCQVSCLSNFWSSKEKRNW